MAAPVWTGRKDSKQSLPRDAGVLINIGSVFGLRALTIATPCSAIKAYVLNFTNGLKLEVQGARVKVRAVLPAGTPTEFYDHTGIPLSAFDPAVLVSVGLLADPPEADVFGDGSVWRPDLHDPPEKFLVQAPTPETMSRRLRMS